jgi:hypothetical protein
MALITDPDLLAVGTEITIDTTARTFTLVEAGDLVAKDGVDANALWSFFVDLWNTGTYQPFPFPMNKVDNRSGQYVFGRDPGGNYNGWKPASDATRQMIRNGGWSEYSSGGVLNRQYFNAVLQGSAKPAAQLYYQKASGGAAANYTFDDLPNEAIQVYGDASNGNFDSRTYFKSFHREQGYTFDDSSLVDINETATGAYKLPFGINSALDLDVTDVDAEVTRTASITAASWASNVATFTATAHGFDNGDVVVITGVTPTAYNRHGVVANKTANTFEITIGSNPGTYTSGGTASAGYSKVVVKYFSGAFSKDIDSATDRSFGIVVEAGTHSGIDGAMTAAGTVLTSATGAIDTGGYFSGGVLKVWEGTNAGTYNVASVTATTITITGSTFAATESSSSYTLYPAGGLGLSLQQIYTKVQYQLRQNSNINAVSGGSSITGKTADLLLNFVGPSLKCGFYAPANAAGGGSGVLVEGLRDADVNSIVFYDNTAATREYPYSSSGTFSFNAPLVGGYYKLFYTTPPSGDDFGEAAAVVVDNAAGADIAGTITGTSVSFNFDWSNNTQAGYTAGQERAVTLVWGNPGSAKPGISTGTISQSKSISIAAVAESDPSYVA